MASMRLEPVVVVGRVPKPALSTLHLRRNQYEVVIEWECNLPVTPCLADALDSRAALVDDEVSVEATGSEFRSKGLKIESSEMLRNWS